MICYRSRERAQIFVRLAEMYVIQGGLLAKFECIMIYKQRWTIVFIYTWTELDAEVKTLRNHELNGFIQLVILERTTSALTKV